ncbi:MAG: glycogen/starch synthase [Muribaculaceae bacterium]|nr:glycogen/starch synthase [Muribaculaceae bacterium]
MEESNKAINLLIETSWEVCNKIGGIYTVLSTKARVLNKLYGDKVVFIGPDVWTEEHPSPFFTEDHTVLKDWKEALMLPEGVSVRVGRWDIPGRPKVILVRFDGMYACKDAFYGRMWELYGVDSLHAYGDYDEACAFSHAAGLVIENLVNYQKKTKALPSRKPGVIAHFDEWTTGMGLLYVKDVCPDVATVFTTHATSIGRSICGNGKPLYDYLHAYSGDGMAAELNMESKHSLEKAAAVQADVFTTVSEVTARECKQFFEREPLVTPNGFEEDFVPKPRALAAVRKTARHQLLRVATALTGKHFDDKETFIVATSGRCEYRNKGLDLFLDAMNVIESAAPPKSVLSFVLVPAWSAGQRVDLAKALTLDDNSGVKDPVLTHELNNYFEDPINSRLHQLNFAWRNSDPGSKVTTIYVPCYLNGADGIIDLKYYDVLPGCDVTAFASYYEPWGYTPLESVAFGVPTITTSLSGFGQWVLSTGENSFEDTGVRVENRTDSNYAEVCSEMASDILQLINSSSKTMNAISKAARNTADKASWAHFMKYYETAYITALKSVTKRVKVNK